MLAGTDKLKLDKGSAFVKRDMRVLPLTDVEFEADFFLDSVFSSKLQEHWQGMVIERESCALLATHEVPLPPPPVNSLANLLAHAMLRSWFGARQRPCTIHLRDRPQWQALLPHLQQLGIEVVLGQDLPWFDKAVIEWIQYRREHPPSTDEIKAILRKPFPQRKPTSFDGAMALMEWSDAMFKAVYPTRKNAVSLGDPERSIPIRLAADELEMILTETKIAKTKKLRPRIEAMAAKGKTIDLEIKDWSRIVLALCAPQVDAESSRKRLLRMATTIADHLAGELGIEGPPVGKWM